MKISELKDAPRWLLDAKTVDADVTIENGVAVWHSGTWLSGTWEDGTWLSGTWHDGIWEDGEWLGGSLLGGTWHRGVWHSGTWYRGTWHDGTWLGGKWLDGVWHKGVTTPRSKYIPLISGGNITIGCKTKTIEEWDAWFAGTGVYTTPRYTEAFKLIYAHYCATKAFMEAAL